LCDIARRKTRFLPERLSNNMGRNFIDERRPMEKEWPKTCDKINSQKKKQQLSTGPHFFALTPSIFIHSNIEKGKQLQSLIKRISKLNLQSTKSQPKPNQEISAKEGLTFTVFVAIFIVCPASSTF